MGNIKTIVAHMLSGNQQTNKSQPQLEIDRDDCVLVYLPSGKRNYWVQFKDQSEQKVGTCWYYAFCKIRPRYKNFVDTKLEDISFPRQKEKILSTYRKTLTVLNERRSEVYHFIEKYGSFINGVQAKLLLKHSDIAKSVQALLSDFIEQNSDQTFQDFFFNRNLKARIEVAQETLEALGVNIVKALEEQMLHTFPGKSMSELTLEETTVLHYFAVKQAAMVNYQLVPSNWQPRAGFQGIKELMHFLRVQGAHVTFGYQGRPYYKTELKDKKLVASRVVYYLASEDYDPSVAERGAHAIIVIGAEIIEGQTYIYFVDPRDPSPLLGDRITYRIGYSEFLSHLTNVHGISLVQNHRMVEEIMGPFAVCATTPVAMREVISHYSPRINISETVTRETYSPSNNDQTLTKES